ncbi:hypothetical protein ABPG75_011218 [Micractinium tetrahymenae]
MQKEAGWWLLLLLPLLTARLLPLPAADAGSAPGQRPWSLVLRFAAPPPSHGPMSKSCKGLLKELVKCLRESDCMKEGKPIKECAKQAPECDGLRNAYSACKRGQLDARSRLRGNKGY